MGVMITFAKEPFLWRLKRCVILLFGGGVPDNVTVTRAFLEEGIAKLDLETVL